MSSTHLLQSFFDRLPDHQAGINRGSTHPTQLDSEVNQISQALQTCMINTALNLALMLNFKSEITSIPSINLTREEADIHYPPLRGNITQDPEDNLNTSTVAPGHPSIDMVFVMNHSHIAPSHTGSAVAPAVQSTSGLQGIPTSSLIIDKKTFSPKSINRVKALMSKENRAHNLITVGAEEVATRFDAPTSQDEEGYDSDVSRVNEEDAEVVPDKEDNAQIKTSKSAEDNMLQDNEGQEETNKEEGDQTAKPDDKKPVQKHGNQASSGSQDGPDSHNKDVSPQVKRPNTSRTTFPFIAPRELAGCFS